MTRPMLMLLVLISCCDEPTAPPQTVKKPEVEKAPSAPAPSSHPLGYPWDHGDPVVMPGDRCPPLADVNIEACPCWAIRSELRGWGKVECDKYGRYPEEERKRKLKIYNLQ